MPHKEVLIYIYIFICVKIVFSEAFQISKNWKRTPEFLKNQYQYRLLCRSQNKINQDTFSVQK